ncbi:MAG: glycosyltransferase [Lachnospiraceae bacterium]|nr:glycosyltransferase [Lachnospiraceae bacterium]
MQINNYAPVVLFVYNRPEHTRKTVEALKQNIGAEETELYVFCDYPKKEQMREKVEETRAYVRNITGFKQVHITMREENWGLARSIIHGVTEVVGKHGRVIVMEDDLVTDRYFLNYMSTGLERYEKEKKVFSITGYSHYPNGNPKLPESYFLKVFSSWTWATWADRWATFDENATGWEETKTNPKVKRAFDYENCLDNSLMMKQQMEEHSIDSWAIRAYWTMFRQDGMTLFPNKRLCENIGFDGTGVHCNTEGDYNNGSLAEHELTEFPATVEETKLAKREFIRQIHRKKRAYRKLRIRHYLCHPVAAFEKVVEKMRRR